MDLSAVYLDVIKDRLYCSHPTSAERRSAQTVLYRLARTLTTVMAPVLAFTSDEAWEHVPGEHAGAVLLETFDLIADAADDPEADARFARLLALREEVNKELEVHRQQGEFGKSLEAALRLGGDRAALDADLAATRATIEELCIVSQVTHAPADDAPQGSLAYPGLSFGVRKADGAPCPRCWQLLPKAGHPAHPDLCARCLEVVLALGKDTA